MCSKTHPMLFNIVGLVGCFSDHATHVIYMLILHVLQLITTTIYWQPKIRTKNSGHRYPQTAAVQYMWITNLYSTA